MAKIPFMKLADVNTVKTNASAYLKHFSENDNSWLEKELGHSPFGKTKYDLPDIQLYMPEDQKHKKYTDGRNVREVYSKLMFLSPSQASDERLWAGLCMGPYWNYVSYRWDIKEAEDIKHHYFFGYGARRSLTRNALSRLWWIGRLTYDEDREDHFELSDYVCEQSRFIVDVLERNVSDSLPLMREFLGACLDLEKAGYHLNTENIRDLQKYMDVLGGVYVLDYMPKGFLYKKIRDRADALIKEGKIKSA